MLEATIFDLIIKRACHHNKVLFIKGRENKLLSKEGYLVIVGVDGPNFLTSLALGSEAVIIFLFPRKIEEKEESLSLPPPLSLSGLKKTLVVFKHA